jgi:hypothetical protein
MKTLQIIFIILLMTGMVSGLQAQVKAMGEKSVPDAEVTGLAKGLGIYVFPSENQDQKTQDADEMACYRWAVQQSGFDPLNPAKVEAGQAYTGPDGSAVGGAARGAAAGAAIGAIAGDAGKGAAIGAVTGAMSGARSRAVRAQAQQQQMNQAADAANKEMMNNFKKAFSVCMEGKGYSVK